MKKGSGIPLYIYSPSEGENPNPELVSGLITALRGFAENLGYQLTSADFRDKKLSLVTKKDICGFLIADKVTPGLTDMLEELVRLFSKLYGPFPKAFEKGATSKFSGFTEVVPYVIKQYATQRENDRKKLKRGNNEEKESEGKGWFSLDLPSSEER